MDRIDDIARETADRFGMFAEGEPVLAMVSGGADSVALLHLLASGAFGDVPVRVLHINHMLRGEESDADEAFVLELGERLGVETRTVRYDVGAYAEAEGLNLEDAGRRIRYRFAEEELDSWCQQLRVREDRGRIAVAHTLDDRIETFFMRALFGAGTGGLASIAAVRERIVRPLLRVQRQPLRDWLIEGGRDWREDATNQDSSRLRAHVRFELLPCAEKVNPAFRTALGRTMDLLAGDDALLSSMADAFSRDFAEVTPGLEVAFNRELMGTLDRTMARRTVRAALKRAFPETSRIEAEHVEMLVNGLSVDGFSHVLPGGLRAFGEYGKMIVSHPDSVSPTVALSLLTIPGKADLGPAGAILAESAGPEDTFGDDRSVIVDAAQILGELTIDAPRPGDRMRPFGMEGTRKLSDLLVDAKVPKRVRSATPVVRDGERVVWLAGVRMSEDYRVTAGTTECVRLTWIAEETESA